MTQQNAAMVGETSEASRRLAEEADMLLGLVQQFKIDSQKSMESQDSRAA